MHGLDWAGASTETVRDAVSSAWRKVETGYTLDVTIPMGATATIVLSKLQMAAPTAAESSGTYHFVVKEREP